MFCSSHQLPDDALAAGLWSTHGPEMPRETLWVFCKKKERHRRWGTRRSTKQSRAEGRWECGDRKQWKPLARSTEQSLTEEQKVSAAGEEGTRKRSYKLSIRVPDCGARKSVFNPAGVKSNKI